MIPSCVGSHTPNPQEQSTAWRGLEGGGIKGLELPVGVRINTRAMAHTRPCYHSEQATVNNPAYLEVSKGGVDLTSSHPRKERL